MQAADMMAGPFSCLLDLREVDETLSAWTAGTILAPEELARAERFAVPGPARTFIAGRLLLRNLVARMSGCQPHDVTLRLEANGKPVVEHPRDIHVNLTHSQGWVLAAATGRPLGIDMEAIRPMDWQLVARHFLSTADRDWLEACPSEDRHRFFFHLWTWKEAVAKAVGSGLGLFDDLPPPCEFVHVAGQSIHVAQLQLPEPLVGYLATIIR